MLVNAAGFPETTLGNGRSASSREVLRGRRGHPRFTDGDRRFGFGRVVDGIEQAFLDVCRGHALDGVAHFLGDSIGAVSASIRR